MHYYARVCLNLFGEVCPTKGVQELSIVKVMDFDTRHHARQLCASRTGKSENQSLVMYCLLVQLQTKCSNRKRLVV